MVKVMIEIDGDIARVSTLDRIDGSTESEMHGLEFVRHLAGQIGTIFPDVLSVEVFQFHAQGFHTATPPKPFEPSFELMEGPQEEDE